MRDFISRAINVVWPSGLGLSSLNSEYRAIEDLVSEGNSLAHRTIFATANHRDIVMAMMQEACDQHGRDPHQSIKIAICVALDGLMRLEGIIAPDIDWAEIKTSFAYKDDIRRILESRRNFFRSFETNWTVWRRKLVATFAGILSYFPDHAFRDRLDGPQFSISLSDTVEKLSELLDRIYFTLEDNDFIYPGLAKELRDTFFRNILIASGIDPNDRSATKRKLIPPRDSDLSSPELIDRYLRNTPFQPFFTQSLPFAIPEQARFEHCHILGGTGHGKTQLLQQLIFADLEKAQTERRSIVVIDSQGDLIRKLSHLRLFGRNEEYSLYSKFCLIDPSDIEYPVALNMFAVNRERLEHYGKAEREKVLNGTVELYENFFGSLLGAELTQKQGVIFRYLARLMLEIPGANIHTLRDLMDDAEPFIPYMEKLTGSARYFFEREFFDRSFSPTKKQISKRLWGVLATPSFERMFAQKENKIDMFELLNEGTVIFINTAKDLLKQEGCELFGRFFLSMITQAAMERSVIEEDERTPTTVYVDEAQEYFDESIDMLLAQGRKYKIGLVCGNQTLDQLTPSLRASFMANTGTKVVGGLSAKDANAFASEMRCDADFLQSLRKKHNATEFALSVRHHTPQAVRIEVPLGHLEQQDTLSKDQYEELLDRSRTNFAIWNFEQEEAPRPFARPEQDRPKKAPKSAEHDDAGFETSKAKKPTATEQEVELQNEIKPEKDSSKFQRPEALKAAPTPRAPMPPKPGRGGREHKYLQELVKGLAEQHGYLARIEEEVLDGEGFVDVSLTRNGERIACEIAVTTPVEKEVQNIRKCLEAGFGKVWVISSEAKHLAAIRKGSEAAFGGTTDAVLFIRAEDIQVVLAESGGVAREDVVRGYKVRVKRAGTTESGSSVRKELGGILAKSS